MKSIMERTPSQTTLQAHAYAYQARAHHQQQHLLMLLSDWLLVIMLKAAVTLAVTIFFK